MVIRGTRVVTPTGTGPASVHVRDGRIERVSDWDDAPPDAVDVGSDVLFPGLVDTHVHINEPGRTTWEGFETATRAAAAGGVTTLMDMPLNSIPPTTTVAGLLAKAAAADGKCWVDVGFCGGLIPGNAGELRGLREAGALAFKCFLAPSGVDEFAHVEEEHLRAGMRVLAGLGAPLLVHAELPGPLEAAEARASGLDPRAYRRWLDARPRSAEDAAVELITGLCRHFGARTHVVHLSSADALAFVTRAKDANAPFTAETCPHYLHFGAEQIQRGRTAFKCAPPIREAENRERLWDALRQGTLDQVVTDHSPASPDVKCVESGDFAAAWGGIASLQLGLPVIWTEARARGHSFADLARWMCETPARLAGLESRKGAIRAGLDADLVAWDPDAPFSVAPERLFHRHALTPYAGERLFGVVRSTWVRGLQVYAEGRHVGGPAGRWLRA